MATSRQRRLIAGQHQIDTSLEIMQASETVAQLDRFSTASLESLFASPVMYFDWPESEGLNTRLKEIVLETRKRSAGVVKTNRGGWQSDADLQSWPQPEITELTDRVRRFAQEYVRR